MAKKHHSSWWLLRAGLALLLAFIIGIAASCSDLESGKVTTGNSPPPVTTPDKPAPAAPDDNRGDSAASEPMIVAENEAFRIYAPAPNAVVGSSFKVSGEARVFEASFNYSFEDGHNVLAEGYVMADQGAPAWGKFEFEVAFKNPTSPYGILSIYESSAEDGRPIHQLEIPVKFKDDIVKPVSGEG